MIHPYSGEHYRDRLTCCSWFDEVLPDNLHGFRCSKLPGFRHLLVEDAMHGLCTVWCRLDSTLSCRNLLSMAIPYFRELRYHLDDCFLSMLVTVKDCHLLSSVSVFLYQLGVHLLLLESVGSLCVMKGIVGFSHRYVRWVEGSSLNLCGKIPRDRRLTVATN